MVKGLKIELTKKQLQSLVNESTGNKTVDQFIKYAKKKLKIKDPVDIKLQNSKEKIKTTGVYRHEDETKKHKPEIRIYTKDRLMADVLRSLGHELEHHKQKQDNKFPKHTSNRHRKKEDDANVEAGKLTFSFGKKDPSIFEKPFKKTKD